MKQLPPVDDEVYADLQQVAEPLVDDINSVLRRLLDHYRRTGSTPAPAPPPHRAGPVPAPSSRARRGTTLADADYELPLLSALIELGGRAATSEATDEVGRILAARLGDVDKAALNSGDIRWRNRTAFARLSLVKRGDMDGDTPRGVWAITEQGRVRVREVEPA